MTTAVITRTITISRNQTETFAAVTAWQKQGVWIPFTTVRVSEGDGHSQGSAVIARTGIGRFGIDDVMTITTWDPPLRCSVEHIGRYLKGSGVFLVEPVSEITSRFTWTETVNISYGSFGNVVWKLLRPIATLALQLALRRLRRRLLA